MNTMNDNDVNGMVEALGQAYKEACDRKDYRLCDVLREQIRSLCLATSHYTAEPGGVIGLVEA
jgi:hypothetical protein